MLPNPSQLGTVTPVRSVLCVEPSLKQNWLCGSLFVFSKVAQTHAHEPIALLWTKVDSFSQLEDDARQFFARDGGDPGVWLRVRILNSPVFSLRTTVRATRDSLREADQTFSARRRIIGSVSAKDIAFKCVLNGY